MENNYYQGYQAQEPLPNSTAILVLGISSIVGCFCYGLPGTVLAIISLVLASKSKQLYNANPTAYTPGSVSNMNTGRICAIIGLTISILFLALAIFGIAYFGMEALRNPEEYMKRYE
ncbi:CCC motif membrane protein [Aridibaculum aurantiacum]|uniref:CCC motif membrane protein n=1 Tax=Aridibaculum aurantiacum TaxID=2810307 RepID=UPI001A95D3E4|nr:CCC motif membrane protein [Aridibaculum aurantiacum]